MTAPTPADPERPRPRTAVLAAVVVGGFGAVCIALGARGPNDDRFGTGLLLMLAGVGLLAAAPGLLRGSRPTRVYAVLLITASALGALADGLGNLAHYLLLGGAAIGVALLTLVPPVRVYFEPAPLEDATGMRMGS